MKPRIVVQPQVGNHKLIFNLPEKDVELCIEPQSIAKFSRLLQTVDGTHTVHELANRFSFLAETDLNDLFDNLYEQGVIDDCALAVGRPGIDVLFELEDLTNQLLYQTVYNNVFWCACKNANSQDDIPINVMRGLVIENYHLLHREGYFDAPVLSYVSNTAVRLAMNAFYAEEYGHDELLLKSLIAVGITRTQLSLTIPLPQTLAMCNALAYWAHNDPLFFFTTMGILEGRDIKQNSFIDAAIRIGLEPEFIGPIKAHANINFKGRHGHLTREIFTNIPIIDLPTIQRLRAKTQLFIELYDAFYTGVWDFYTTSTKLLRLDTIL